MAALIHASHLIAAIAGPICKSFCDLLAHRAEIRRIDAQVLSADADHRHRMARLGAEAAGFDAQMRLAHRALKSNHQAQMVALRLQRERFAGALLLASQNSAQLHVERSALLSMNRQAMARLVAVDASMDEKQLMRSVVIDLGSQVLEMQRLSQVSLSTLTRALPAIEPPRALLAFPR